MNRIELERVKPGRVGLRAQGVEAFLDGLEQAGLQLHSLMILRHDKVAAEGWWAPYDKDTPHMMFSLSKSFTALGVGLAVQEGRMRLSDKPAEYFPELLPARPCENMALMTVKDMLCMSTGHSEEPEALVPKTNWAERFLRSYVDKTPGTVFTYNTAASYMLSAMVQKATGERLLTYLTPRLFDKLGIEKPTWEQSPQGVDAGGFGLSLKTEDIARFGWMLLHRGEFMGQRVIAPEWVDEMSAYHADNSPGREKDWAQGYGYQIWRCVPHGVYRGDGAFGQYCIVMPEQDAVIAITSGVSDMQAVLDLVWAHILPAMEDAPIEDQLEAEAHLRARLGGLSIPLPAGDRMFPQNRNGETVFGDNPLGLKKLRLTFEGFSDRLEMEFEDGTHLHCPVGHGCYLPKATPVPLEHSFEPQILGRKVCCAGAWDSSEYHLRMVHITTPWIDDLRLTFTPGGLTVQFERNVGFTPMKWTLTGIRA